MTFNHHTDDPTPARALSIVNRADAAEPTQAERDALNARATLALATIARAKAEAAMRGW